MSNTLIFHIDVNSAFLSWEAVDRLKVSPEEVDLRTIPSAIGGDAKKRHGIILAKSTPAKKYNVQTAETISSALKKCPSLFIVPPRPNIYSIYSKQFISLLSEYSPVIEQTSIDEAFCDMTGTEKLFGETLYVANTIKDRIKNELHFTVNIGISSNKLLAKMASDFEKPDKIHTLFPNEIEKKMWPLPVRNLLYVGKVTENKLNGLGIDTIGKLANTDVKTLRRFFKNQAETLHNYANGIDMNFVDNTPRDNSSYSHSTTMSHDVTNPNEAKHVLLSLCEKVSYRLRLDHVMAECISVEITNCYFEHSCRQITILSSTNITNEIFITACDLFDKLWDGSPIRLLGVKASKVITAKTQQLNLFDLNQNVKLSKLDVAIDEIRNRYGNQSVIRASFLDNKD
jgi:DNA polymerase-4